MKEGITRRGLLGSLAASPVIAADQKKKRIQAPLPQAGEFVRFSDPTTENVIVRLTSPAYSHILPPASNRFLLLKPRVLYCSSDRLDGVMMPFEIDLRTGSVRPVAKTSSLDPASLTLDRQGRAVYFLDGGRLSEVTAGKSEAKRNNVLASDVTAFGVGDSRSELFLIRGGRLEQLRGNSGVVLTDDAAGPCLPRPGGAGCVFVRRPDAETTEYWYAPMDAPNAKPKLLARGRVSAACWSADGEALWYLRDVPKNNVLLSEIYQARPEEPGERCISRTSQFASFALNEDASVFVGASASKAQPNVLLLLRSAQRELTLCEHRASHAADVRPVFSPDSRRVYFQSDREGKSAIYSVNVERLIEPTAGSRAP